MEDNKQLSEAGMAKVLQAGLRKPVDAPAPIVKSSGLLKLIEAFNKQAEADGDSKEIS